MSQLVQSLERRLLFAGPEKILFIRGAERSGGFYEAVNDTQRTEQLADINNQSTANGNHGWYELAQALRGEGFDVSQTIEPLESGAPSTGQTQGAPINLAGINLGQYALIVFGSNNAVYTAASINALENYVRGGGAAMFISDANFGSNWADAPNSDQQFLSRFGITVNQDQGTYTLQRSAGDFVAPDHPIFAGVNQFDGEGVSPVWISNSNVSGVSAQRLAKAKNLTRINAPPYVNSTTLQGQSRPVDSGDASLLIATAGSGRLAGYFDRNTFFNLNGAGTSIHRFDNRRFAVNLFRWLVFGGDGTPPTVQSTGFRFETVPQAVTFTFSENVAASIDPDDVLLENLTNGRTYIPSSTAYESGNTAVFRINGILPDGNYRATLHAGGVRDSAGTALQADSVFNFFFLSGDANRDRSVNFSDFSILVARFNMPGTFSQGDFDYTGTVSIHDFALLASKFNSSLPPAANASSASRPGGGGFAAAASLRAVMPLPQADDPLASQLDLLL